MSYLRLKKNNYLAIIPLTGDKKMVEVEAKTENEAYNIAEEYAVKYCNEHGYMFINPTVIRIPDCISVIG